MDVAGVATQVWMRSPGRRSSTTGATLGAYAGLLGLGHGILEALQGARPTNGLVIDANGGQTNLIFRGNEPALTVLPDFRTTGILACLVGLTLIAVSLAALRGSRGGRPLVLLSIVLLFVGGGLTPIPFGVLGGLALLASSRTSLEWLGARVPANSLRALGLAWPWSFLAALALYAALMSLGSAMPQQVMTKLGASGLALCTLAVAAAVARDAAGAESARAGEAIMGA